MRLGTQPTFMVVHDLCAPVLPHHGWTVTVTAAELRGAPGLPSTEPSAKEPLDSPNTEPGFVEPLDSSTQILKQDLLYPCNY